MARSYVGKRRLARSREERALCPGCRGPIFRGNEFVGGRKAVEPIGNRPPPFGPFRLVTALTARGAFARDDTRPLAMEAGKDRNQLFDIEFNHDHSDRMPAMPAL